ncbi:hypothetical protein VR5_267 [Escherichia phage vb_EcoM-VR5]|jgi:hypothetical protein|uniref:Uncharacterized protein n=1 Tax=Escherichia phage vb_EcoM-VR5 TaxID=1567026 RepID=A0A0A7HFP8_9CAUD|nr:hypothetical protein AVV69_gp141 [Escherichia phage vb_EcoM-VR5]AIZ02054.1 hypothetical protein VR5_267 [Escherichia phage vb_EcoM-VR5]UPW37986.1 DNA-directed DNA polymerase [Escherichia phage vB_EcoM_ESCO10]
MKKLLKAIWNMFILFMVLCIFPIAFMIDHVRVYFNYFF